MTITVANTLIITLIVSINTLIYTYYIPNFGGNWQRFANTWC